MIRRRAGRALGAVLVASAVGTGVGSTARADGERPTFAVWYARNAPDDFEALRVLLGHGKGAEVERFDTARGWMASRANVLVLRGSPGLEGRLGAPSDHGPLRGRRVLGIGEDAGLAFEDLGLDVRSGFSRTFSKARAVVKLVSGSLVPGSKDGQLVEAFRSPGTKPRKWDCEGLFLPPGSPYLENVEVLARWPDAEAYAPIARQQNYVFWGIASELSTWSQPFREELRDVAHALARRPLEPFSLPARKTSEPGTQELTLPGSAADEKVLFFRFEDPCLFEAHLKVEGGQNVMLRFGPERGHREDDRRDTDDGPEAKIVMPISPEGLEVNPRRYWTLTVSNSSPSLARCVLRVAITKDAVLKLPGIDVPIGKPPSDPASIRKLMELMGSGDPEVRRLAETALLAVGRRALRFLQVAADEEEDGWERFGTVIRRLEK